MAQVPTVRQPGPAAAPAWEPTARRLGQMAAAAREAMAQAPTVGRPALAAATARELPARRRQRVASTAQASTARQPEAGAAVPASPVASRREGWTPQRSAMEQRRAGLRSAQAVPFQRPRIVVLGRALRELPVSPAEAQRVRWSLPVPLRSPRPAPRALGARRRRRPVSGERARGEMRSADRPFRLRGREPVRRQHWLPRRLSASCRSPVRREPGVRGALARSSPRRSAPSRRHRALPPAASGSSLLASRAVGSRGWRK